MIYLKIDAYKADDHKSMIKMSLTEHDQIDQDMTDPWLIRCDYVMDEDIDTKYQNLDQNVWSATFLFLLRIKRKQKW